MVLVLKVISCAINYGDGILKEEGLREAQKKYRLTRCPSIIEYIGFCLCCGSHFAGPVFEMKDYLDYTEKKGVRPACNIPNRLRCLFLCFSSGKLTLPFSFFFLTCPGLGTFKGQTSASTLWRHLACYNSSSYMYGFILVFGTTFPTFPV